MIALFLDSHRELPWPVQIRALEAIGHAPPWFPGHLTENG